MKTEQDSSHTHEMVSAAASLIQGVALTVRNEINQSQILTVDDKEIRSNHMVSKVTCLSNPVIFLLLQKMQLNASSLFFHVFQTKCLQAAVSVQSKLCL